jgi:hypothetical protein
MNIAFTIDDLTTQPQTAASRKTSPGFAYWILGAGILSGAGALVLAMIINR